LYGCIDKAYSIKHNIPKRKPEEIRALMSSVFMEKFVFKTATSNSRDEPCNPAYKSLLTTSYKEKNKVAKLDTSALSLRVIPLAQNTAAVFREDYISSFLNPE